MTVVIKKGNAPGGSSFQTLHARSFSVRETKNINAPLGSFDTAAGHERLF